MPLTGAARRIEGVSGDRGARRGQGRILLGTAPDRAGTARTWRSGDRSATVTRPRLVRSRGGGDPHRDLRLRGGPGGGRLLRLTLPGRLHAAPAGAPGSDAVAADPAPGVRAAGAA